MVGDTSKTAKILLLHWTIENNNIWPPCWKCVISWHLHQTFLCNVLCMWDP